MVEKEQTFDLEDEPTQSRYSQSKKQKSFTYAC